MVPGLGRWLEYTYPTNLATKMFCHDQIIHSVAGGGSKGACHAVVQCLLLESLGVALLLEGSTIQCLCCPLLPGSTSPHVLLMMAYLRPFWQSPTQLAPLARNPATAWAAAL